MVSAKIVSATDEHLAALIRRGLRPADEAEALRAGARSGADAILDSYHLSSVRFAILVDQQCIGLLGVCPQTLFSDVGMPWLLAASEIEKYWRRFAIVSKEKTKIFFEQWSLLYNWVDARNSTSIRWLRWIGFDVSNTVTSYGPNQMPFYYFEKRRDI